MSNKSLWDRVCKTDPRHVKPITGKQYQGNSPKPYWIVERMTEEFGPCGIGWGFTILNERMERLAENEILHVAVVRLWYELEGKRGELEQIGQTKCVYEKSKGGLMVDEDAPKKSITDALVKCASYLGFAGDIFSGRWDDSKYVAEIRKEFMESDDIKDKLKASIEAAKSAKSGKPMDGAGDSLSDDRKAELDDFALHLIDLKNEGRSLEAAHAYYELPDNDDKLYVWRCLGAESKLRAEIKQNSPHRTGATA